MVIAVLAVTILPSWWSVVGWIGNVLSGIMGAGQILNFFISMFL
ncbi:MAG: hypothetical protein ACXVIF_06470 [Halobacteriota archaeon]